MTNFVLFKTGWRYLLRHPWQSLLMVLGVTLGVAVVVAVDLANQSASRAFDLSSEAVAGKATHLISAGPQGVPDQVYVELRRSNLDIPMAPVINEYVSSPEMGGQTLQLLGMDPFAEPPFRDYLRSEATDFSADPADIASDAALDLSAFLTEPGAIFISSSLAERYSLELGQEITLDVGGRSQPARILGLLAPSDDLSRRLLEGLIIADLSTVQELSDRRGWLDRIDLILPPGIEGDQAIEQIRLLLPPSARLEPVSARSGAVEQMTAAFRINLTALSLLALLVGLFLIFNTMTFSVVQRRPLFGILRSLGATRQEIFGLVLSEALLIGLTGGLLGVLLGLVMGQGAVRLVTQTINDLYYVVSVRGIQIPPLSLVKGMVLGILATLLSAAPPAWEAASVPPRLALSRSGLESKAHRAVWIAAISGMAVIAAGILVLVIPTRSLVISFLGTFAVIVGCALLVPLITQAAMRLLVRPLGRLIGVLGRMAPRNVIGSLSRTTIAVMALMVAVSVTIGVSLMVGSFRETVADWLADSLQGDIYIATPGETASTPSVSLDPNLLPALRSWPGVMRVDVLRSVNASMPQGEVHIAATDNYTIAEERKFLRLDLEPGELWSRLEQGSVIVSEPLANRLDLPTHGASLRMLTSAGWRDFPVLGVYYDYANPQGTALMALSTYQEYFDDPQITAIALRLKPGEDIDRVVADLQDRLVTPQKLLIRANQSLRLEAMAIFERTFAITSALQLLAMVVAFIGVLSALLSLELERQREMGILRSVGLTIRQLWELILIETGLLGAVAGLLSMPTGYLLALILVFIINRRSFGWTLQMHLEILPFLQALALAVSAALLAGIIPALRMGRLNPSETLHAE